MKANRAQLKRVMSGEQQTVGKWYCLDQDDLILDKFDTTELAWKDNQPFISCIPLGKYLVEKRYTEQRGWHFHIKDVEGRSWILVHVGNFHYQIEGCILPGLDLKHLDDDQLTDVDQSTQALQRMLDVMPDQFELEIV